MSQAELLWIGSNVVTNDAARHISARQVRSHVQSWPPSKTLAKRSRSVSTNGPRVPSTPSRRVPLCPLPLPGKANGSSNTASTTKHASTKSVSKPTAAFAPNQQSCESVHGAGLIDDPNPQKIRDGPIEHDLPCARPRRQGRSPPRTEAIKYTKEFLPYKKHRQC